MTYTSFKNPEVEAVFADYPDEFRTKLLELRQLIFDTAASTDSVGQLEESLKWGEPSYVPAQPKTGSPVRINWKPSMGQRYAIYFVCTTRLVPTCRDLYPTEFTYEGDRAMTFDLDDEVPTEELRHCIELALTYHRIKDSLKPKGH